MKADEERSSPRTILRFIAIIAMNLFTINCACYIAVTVSVHADPRLLHLSRTVGTLCGMMAIAITPILLITVLGQWHGGRKETT